VIKLIMKYFRAAYLSPFIVLLLMVVVHAAEPLKGRSFSDPGRTFEMPPGWVQEPIRYEKWADESDISVTLDQGVYPMILPLIQQYAKQRGLKIAVKEGTCGISAGMLDRKAVDIGAFCCPPGRQDRLPGLRFHTLGIVSLAFLVHPDNPVESVSSVELRNIFQGKLYRWSELKTRNGNPGPQWVIRPIGRFHCPLRPGHWRLLLDNQDLFSPRLYEVGSMPDMIAQVSANKGAIGWEVLGMVEHYEKFGKVKPLRINGYSPTDVNSIATKRYPYYRTYSITTWEGKVVENPKAKALVDYLMKKVENLGPEFGFVPASKLIKAGWKFQGDELVGEPD
jgi:phosphate transport system substrate-binding protein